MAAQRRMDRRDLAGSALRIRHVTAERARSARATQRRETGRPGPGRRRGLSTSASISSRARLLRAGSLSRSASSSSRCSSTSRVRYSRRARSSRTRRHLRFLPAARRARGNGALRPGEARRLARSRRPFASAISTEALSNTRCQRSSCTRNRAVVEAGPPRARR